MLDMKFVLENRDLVEQSIKDREKDIDLAQLIGTYEELNKIKKEIESLRQQRNSSSQKVNELKKKGEDASEIITKMKEVTSELKEKEQLFEDREAQFKTLRDKLPNILDERVPRGNEDREEFRGGVIPKFDFKPKTNWELLVDLGLADFKRGIKAAGDRGWVLTGYGARLNRGITNFLLDFWRQKGYYEILPPFFVNEENLYITGHYPGGEKEVYRTEDGKVFVGTAEISIMAIYANETFSKKEFPLKIVAHTPCFRREAGTRKEEKGLYRTHQFDKVELIHISAKETIMDEYENLFNDMKELYETLELPYRMITLRANDMAGKASIERDMEVWLAGEERWGEVGSIGMTTDYQTRRGHIKCEGDGQIEHAHSFYSTGGVANRILIAILNNNQRKDGSVTVPKVLQGYVGGLEVLK